MGHHDSCINEFDDDFLTSDSTKEEQQFFVELRKVLFKLAKEKSKVYKAVFTVSYNPPRYKGLDSFDLTFMEGTFPIGKSIRSTDLKDIVSELKSLQEPEYPEEIMIKGRKFILVEDQYIPEENIPKTASREDRYKAVMKFDERIKRTGSSEREEK